MEEMSEELHASENTPARAALSALFDENTFVETAAYMKRTHHDFCCQDTDAEYEGVITGYGSVGGRLVFAFAQDSTRMKGAVDATHAKKIAALYDLAIKKDAPVVGIFDSDGAAIDGGVTSLAAYAGLLKTVTDASASITQIAYILGNCTGTCAAVASAFDFVTASDNAHFYVANPEVGGQALGDESVCYRGAQDECLAYVRSLLGFLPETAYEDVDTTDDINRRLGNISFDGDARAVAATVADNGALIEVSQKFGAPVLTAFASIGGVRCGIVANAYTENNGRITTDAAYKIADFLNLCDDYLLPVVTLVDSDGLSPDISVDAVKALAFAYAQLSVPQVTVTVGHAIGAAFALMGSKSLGADIVYTVENAEIGVLPADAAVAFAWNDKITQDVSRKELEEKWRASVSTAAAAAATGEIDDIITVDELRARIASALLMLTC